MANNLGFWEETLRVLGLFPISKEGKFSSSRWYRSVVLTMCLIVFILPVEVYEFVRLLPKRKKPFRLLQASMSMLHKFTDIGLLIFHVRAMRKYRRQLATVCQHLVHYHYRKVDLLTTTFALWSFTNHVIFTYHRTSMDKFASFSQTAFYVRSRMCYVVLFLTRLSVAHMYSALLYYLAQLIKKSTIYTRKSPLNGILQHARLIELTNSIHLCFSFQLLLLVADCAYTVIINTYFVSTLFVPNNRDMTFNKISERVFTFGSLLYYSMLPTNRSENLIKVAEAFNNELFKLMRDSKDLCSNSKLRLYVTMKQTVNFTACGFFSLGYPLVTSIIAAATTYLVILIQFSLLTS